MTAKLLVEAVTGVAWGGAVTTGLFAGGTLVTGGGVGVAGRFFAWVVVLELVVVAGAIGGVAGLGWTWAGGAGLIVNGRSGGG